ncbi:MAG: hypothetical protein A3E78_16950 [Alphaproteobacteria bacterium RIFCSPHIGHO2_12_FULL_63_12]|nr:MAG: hypothetical protein A3E78_16950 [Alphaproteobacteria bacterium RIFCSPHIGHO2_12_FULL_63_12]
MGVLYAERRRREIRARISFRRAARFFPCPGADGSVQTHAPVVRSQGLLIRAAAGSILRHRRRSSVTGV